MLFAFSLGDVYSGAPRPAPLPLEPCPRCGAPATAKAVLWLLASPQALPVELVTRVGYCAAHKPFVRARDLVGFPVVERALEALRVAGEPLPDLALTRLTWAAP